MSRTHYQLFPALDPATESALRASLKLHGQIYPIIVDQHGNVLDGHHRKRLAAELGIDCPELVRHIGDGDDGDEIARTLNMDRRHLDPEERKRMVKALRTEGHSYRAIAGALGTSLGAVQRDAARVSIDTPDTVRGSDGKQYPARRTEPTVHESNDASTAVSAAAQPCQRRDFDRPTAALVAAIAKFVRQVPVEDATRTASRAAQLAEYLPLLDPYRAAAVTSNTTQEST